MLRTYLILCNSYLVNLYSTVAVQGVILIYVLGTFIFYPTVGPYIPPKELYNNGQDWETQTNLTEFAVNILKWYYWNQF